MAGWLSWLRRSEPASARLERVAALRWVVLDVETSGLDVAKDTLLSIGAVAVRAGHIVVDDSFERGVRPRAASDRANILIHGIGEEAQRAGVPPAQACGDLIDWAGAAPLVAFHAAFDRAFLERTVRDTLRRRFDADWLDLAALAPALNPGVRATALDDWLVHFDLPVDERHRAGDDAFATAMLFLRLLAQVPPGERDLAGLRRLAQAGRWLG